MDRLTNEEIKAIVDKLKKQSKLRVRKSDTNDLDQDLNSYVAFAIRDLERIGVAKQYLTDMEDPIILEAVLTYINANYRLDSNHERLMNNYNMILTKIKGGGYKSTP